MDGDYSQTTERLQLTAQDTSHCTDITLVEDTVVEGNEFFLVQVEQIISSDDPVFGPNPEYTEIVIVDNDGMSPLYVLVLCNIVLKIIVIATL